MFKPDYSIDKDGIIVYTINTFTWDIKKSLSNYKKHEVTFEEASTIFSDPYGLDLEDFKHSSLDEKRYMRIGKSNTERILITIYTIRRNTGEKEKIRLISSRLASRKERKTYAGQ
jgi:uncharacterized protein